MELQNFIKTCSLLLSPVIQNSNIDLVLPFKWKLHLYNELKLTPHAQRHKQGNHCLMDEKLLSSKKWEIINDILFKSESNASIKLDVIPSQSPLFSDVGKYISDSDYTQNSIRLFFKLVNLPRIYNSRSLHLVHKSMVPDSDKIIKRFISGLGIHSNSLRILNSGGRKLTKFQSLVVAKVQIEKIIKDLFDNSGIQPQFTKESDFFANKVEFFIQTTFQKSIILLWICYWDNNLKKQRNINICSFELRKMKFLDDYIEFALKISMFIKLSQFYESGNIVNTRFLQDQNSSFTPLSESTTLNPSQMSDNNFAADFTRKFEHHNNNNQQQPKDEITRDLKFTRSHSVAPLKLPAGSGCHLQTIHTCNTFATNNTEIQHESLSFNYGSLMEFSRLIII
ncbi:hypothetical protein B5S31_g1987 [[Candida] boidinii]|nr:hypothetical protein B5S31_g1987 [[Candida] boidinii]